MNNDWRTILMPPATTILQALEIIDRGGMRIGVVVDAAQTLLGVVTDGDIRRGILRKIGLEESVTRVMSTDPLVAHERDSKERILSVMRSRDLFHIPVVDSNRRLITIETLQNLARPGPRENWVVIMAGGLGSRLGPLTRNCPKPMLKVGERPILELILEGFASFGFSRFFFSVNYKKEMIQRHFGDGSRWGVSIRYLEEEARLGTAGSLALLPEVPRHPFFVMNGDLLTRIQYDRILAFHHEQKAHATICVRQVEQPVPYGVVEMNEHHLTGIVEKPVQSYFVNAGIYLLDPRVLALIPSGIPLDMPDLLRAVIAQKQIVAAFPFMEYWIDIGRMGDFQQACRDYEENPA